MAKIEELSAAEFEKFRRCSKVDMYAARGLGKSTTAVDGFVELFSTLLQKAGIDTDTFELERWLDCYYQLRYDAEKEADLARFVAEQIKTAHKLEPVVPRVKCTCGPAVEDKEDEAAEKPRAIVGVRFSEEDVQELGHAGKLLAELVMKRFLKGEV